MIVYREVASYLLCRRMQKKASKKTATNVSVILLVKLVNISSIVELVSSVNERREQIIIVQNIAGC